MTYCGEKSYHPWTAEEDEQLWEARGWPKHELVERFGRSAGGIKSRLLKLYTLHDQRNYTS